MPQSVCRQTTRTEALTLLSNIFKFNEATNKQLINQNNIV